ncbi:tandem-95 repeat protein, partial [Priestia megaterium]|nr:tandem-95 repeat protein [Priestia megaterium]
MPYVNRFLTNANGAITFTGNTFGLNKQANANAPGTAGSIGTFFSVNPTSVDGSFPTGTTANYLQNSSSAILRLPSTTTQILYAELIWGGSYLYGGEDVSSALNNAVTFITPSRTVSVQSDTATRFTLTSSSFYYVRSANVTNLISQAGTYSVLGVPGTQSTTENNANAAGWTLAVVYADPLQKSRNLSIFVGAELTSSATGSSTAAVSGFGTPITGTVNGRLLVSAIEGDSAIVGDQLQFGPTTASLQPVSGPNNPINNFFASQINNDSGTLDTSGQFGSLNSTPGGSLSGARQGWDITNIDVSARLSNNQTSAVVRGTTNGDTYVISALALQVDINAPVLNVSKSANVTSARTGDIITYTVQVSNTGTAAANVLIATDPLSSATTFIPNSLQVDGVTQTNVDIRNGLPLGTLNINQTRVLTYQVKVVGPLTSISSLGNQVFINYQFESTPGNVLTGSGASPVNSVTAINTPPTVPNYTITNPEDTVAIGTVIGNDIDGNPLTYRIGTRPTNGIVTVNPNGQFVYTPNLNFNGTDQFTAIVDDGQGGTATSIVTIINTPVNDNPVTQNYAVITNEDTPLIGQIQATDVDGNSLTFQLQSPPTNGTVTVTNSGSYIYTPNLNFNGIDQFTVLVSDGQGGTAVSTVTVTVTPVNDAPTVPNYTFSTQEDSPVVGAIVGTDVDGNPLSYQLQNRPTNGITVVNTNGTFSYQPNLNFNGTDQFTVLVSDGQGGTAVSTVTINVIPVNDPPITSNVSFTIAEDSTLINRVVAVDPDGDPLTFSLQTAPGNGVAAVNANGTFSYQPNLNFNGTDQFTVLVSDGQGGTAVSTVTVTVTPVNDAPTVPNYTFSTQEDSPVIGAIVGTDVDGNPLSYQLQVAPGNGVAAVNADGTFSYQPNPNFNGTDQFTVLVSDGQGGTAVSTVTINVIPVNDPPITSNVSFTIAEDSTLINQIVAVDPDGNPLTFSLQAAPGNGVAVVNANGTFSYQPNLNFNGTDQFTVLVSDGQGGTAVSTVTVTVTPVNDAPTVPNYTFSTQEDSPVVGAIVGTDVDGNPLSYQLQVTPTNGVAAVNANGTFSYQPNLNFNGSDQFTVLVSDGQGGTAVSTVTINVIPVNDPPITSNVSFIIAEDSTLINQIVAVDPDGNPLTFSLQTAPGNGVAVVNADGTFSYQPNLNFNGTDQFTVLVSDGQGGTAVSTVTVTVTPVNDAPTV